MEPADYLKIIRRHWKVIAALVVVLVVAVYFLSPKAPDPVYEARQTLLREAASGDEGASSADNPSVIQLWAENGEVPTRVATALAYDGSPDDLTARLTVTPNPELGAVELVATGDSPDEAVLLVNTFADELLKFIDERDQARIAEQAEETDARADELSAEMTRLSNSIAAAGGETSPDAFSLVSERDSVAAELAALATEEAGTQTTEWASVQVATSASEAGSANIGASPTQRVFLTAVVATLLGVGLAIMLDRSDSRLHTKEEVERNFGLPVLAEIPLLPLRTRHRAAVFGYENDPRLAEAYRSLRTALLLFRDRLPLEVEAAELASGHNRHAQRSNSRQVILVTSPEAGDGKSSTAANLAMAYAESGQSTLLINWDLWRPIPAKVFEAEDAPGVSEFLEAGNTSLVHHVQSTAVPGLHLVPAGKMGHQPGAQLDSELRLLEEARSLADVVIIDTAPLLATSVTRELVTMADVVVVACRAGRTTSPAAERTAELLERLGAPTLGVVLVGVPTGLFNDYYGNPPSRAERLRTSMMARGTDAPRADYPDEPRADRSGEPVGRPERPPGRRVDT